VPNNKNASDDQPLMTTALRFFRHDREHGYLSNFHQLATPLVTRRFGVACATAEHYFHTQLFDFADAPASNRAIVEFIARQATPYRARVVGTAYRPTTTKNDAEWRLELVEQARAIGGELGDDDTDDERVRRMRDTVERKFAEDADCRQMLASTAPHALVFAAPYERLWGGTVNWLGRLLVDVRATIDEDYSSLSRMHTSTTEVADDARAVRRRVAQLGARPEFVAALGLHLYPRSFSYSVDPRGQGTIVHMYGSNCVGETVAVDVTGYSPYMFIRCHQASDEQIRAFVGQLHGAMRIVLLAQKSWQRDLRAAVDERQAALLVRWQVVDGVSMKPSRDDRGFNGSRTERFIQLWWYAPVCVKAARDLLEWAYEQRERHFASRDEFVAALVSGVVDARERAEAATPQMDVKGNVKSARKRTRNEAALEEEAARSHRTLDSLVVSERKAAQRHDAAALAAREEVVPDDANAFDDPNVDVTFDDVDQAIVEDDAEQRDAEPAARELSVPDDVESFVNASAGRPMFSSLLLDGENEIEVYEADIDFVVRYCIDAGFKAEQCVRVRPEAHISAMTRRGDNDHAFIVDWHDLVLADNERAQNVLQPQVCMSFDCEMELGANNAFPRPETERTLQVAAVFFDPVADPRCERVVRRAFVVGRTELEGFAREEVLSFGDDAQLTRAFGEFVRVAQPDMITGYNIEGFDLNYLFERSQTRHSDDIFNICRRPGQRARVRERQFKSSAHGTHIYKEVTGEGLWIYDLYQAFKRSTSFKLRSYSLEYVSNVFLGDRKEDVAYSAINGLQRSPAGRNRLLTYCMKDALLPARLIGHLTLAIENIEMARMAGVPIDMVCRRGLQIRLKSFLYRKGRYDAVRHLFYTRTESDRLASVGASYTGAHVETPAIGLHDEQVITLDYKSLYPSIMVTFSMCLKTLIPGRLLAKRRAEHALTDDDVWMPHTNALPGTLEDQPVFVRSSHTRGMTQEILQELLDERKRVKRLKKRAKEDGDSTMHAIYDKRQLAIKLNCNSIYGVYGAPSSFAYCPEIAAMVTAYGREMILETKALVERIFTMANGFPFDAKVVYGDTVGQKVQRVALFLTPIFRVPTGFCFCQIARARQRRRRRTRVDGGFGRVGRNNVKVRDVALSAQVRLARRQHH